MRPLLVVGSINFDVSVRVPRLAALGETLMGTDMQLSPGGKGANQAHAARQDGAVVRMVGAVGRDGFADAATERLVSSGVDLKGVKRLPDTTTGVAMIQVTDGGENAIALAPGANARLSADALDTLVDAADWFSHDLLLQWELTPETAMRAAARAHMAGSRVILNLAPARLLDRLELGLIDWCVLNEGELQALTEHLGLHERGRAAARALARHVGHGLVLTQGAQGLYACPRPDGPVHGDSQGTSKATEGLPLEGIHMAAFPVQAVDSTGAGDTFCGVFAASLATGRPVLQALHRASAAAALSCTSRGAQVAQPTAAAIDSFLATITPPDPNQPATTAHRLADPPSRPA